MPRYAHRAGGSGEITYTTSPIYDYSTGNGGEKPPLHRGEYPADVVTHKHPAPKGERDRYDGSTDPRWSESGANYAGFGPGKSAAPNVMPRRSAAPLNNPRGIPYQDKFNHSFGMVGSGEVPKGGIAYRDGAGRVKYRGKSG
jgi:hypothetical protein